MKIEPVVFIPAKLVNAELVPLITPEYNLNLGKIAPCSIPKLSDVQVEVQSNPLVLADHYLSHEWNIRELKAMGAGIQYTVQCNRCKALSMTILSAWH
jgi:hypothetical protein